MNKYNCIIVDDEYSAIELLKEHLNTLYKNIEIINTYTRWNDAVQEVSSGNCDIIFLDIDLHDKNGIDLARFINNKESEVIFVTGHHEYALDAYKINASGYIVKPIDEQELIKTVNKAIERIDNRRHVVNAKDTSSHIHNRIGIPDNNSIRYIKTDNIIYLEAVHKYTKVVTNDNEILSSYNIGKFKEMLDERMFLQVHRSYIININFIRSYEHNGTLILENEKQIPVSKNFRENVLGLFSKLKR